MSKLVDKLKSLSRETAPIGFRPSGPTDQGPPLVIVGQCTAPDGPSRLLKDNSAAPDAILITGGRLSPEAVRHLVSTLPGLPLGLPLDSLQSEDLNSLAEAGADFIVFDLKAPLPVLEVNRLGRFFHMTQELEVTRLSVIAELAPVIDGVILTDAGKGLNLEYLLSCRRALRLLGVPVLARVTSLTTATELKCLWEAGVDGIVVPDIQSTATLRKMAETLPRGQRRKWGSRVHPVVPRIEPPAEDDE